MELSYSPSFPLTIARPNRQLSRPQTQKLARKSCIISTICSPVSPPLGYNGRSSSINISTKHYKLNFILACTQGGSDPITTKKGSSFGEACWRFVRPYTIKGTAIASSCLLARGMIENSNLIEWWLVFKVLSGLFIALCANGFVAGINQIYDIDIDNGYISVESAWLLVVFLAAAGLLVVGLTCGPLLTGLYILSLFIGTAYSAPPLRLKSFPFGTILTGTLGILLNFGVTYFLRNALGLVFQWSTSLVYITAFGTLMGVVMAITKDLPDVEGDSKNNISTLAITFGVRNVAYLGCGLLLVFYVAAILAAIYMPQSFSRSVMIPMHLILALSLIHQTRVLEQENYTREASLKFYMVIWNLYCAEYIMFPFI